jgi:hypothetical protein
VIRPQKDYPLGGVQCSLANGTHVFYKLDDPNLPDQVCIPQAQFPAYDQACHAN